MNVYENLSSDIASETSLSPEQADEVVSFLSTEAALDIPLLEQTYETWGGIGDGGTKASTETVITDNVVRMDRQHVL